MVLHTAYDPRLADEAACDRQREPDLSGFTAAQREAAYARRHCVLTLIDLERSRPELAAPALHAFVIGHARSRFPTLKITSKTLYRWRLLYRDSCDLLALVDRRGGDRRSMGSPEAWAELRRLYLSDHQPSLRDVW